MSKISAISLALIIIILFAGTAFFGWQFYASQNNLQKVLQKNVVNASVANFQKLFVQKVLMAQKEVPYEDRLNLENAAVATKDKDLLDAWHNFLNSKTEADAQQTAVQILNLCASKINF